MRLVELAAEHEMLVVEDNPYGLLRYGGEPLPPLYQLDGGDFVIYLGTFSKILSPGIRLGWVVAPPPVLEKIVLGKGAADLCTSTLTQFFVREYFAEGRWQDYVDDLLEPLQRPPRHDAGGARRALPRRRRPGPNREGGLFIWATLPEYIDTGDLLAKALRADVAFVPGPAAYVDGRGEQLDAAQLLRRQRRGDPRGHPPDRPGDRASRSSSTRRCDRRPPSAFRRRTRPEQDESRRASNVFPLRKAGEAERVKVAVLKGGRSLERGVSLRSAARVEDALERLGHEVVADRRRRRPGRDACAPSEPDVAFVAMHGRRRRGRHRAGAAGDPRHPLHRPRRRRLRPLHRQGRWPSTRCARPASRRPTGSPSPRPPSASSAPPTRSATSRSSLGFPLVVKPSRGGSSLGVKFAARRRRGPAAPSSPPSATTTGCCWSASSRVASWRSASSATRPLPIVEAIPDEGDRYDFEARYEIGRTRFVCPAELAPTRARRGHRRRRSRTYRALGCAGFARVDLILAADGPWVLEVNAIPGLTDTSLLPQAAEAAGMSFEELVERILDLALAPSAA